MLHASRNVLKRMMTGREGSMWSHLLEAHIRSSDMLYQYCRYKLPIKKNSCSTAFGKQMS